MERLRRIYSNDGLTAAARASSSRLVALKPNAYGSREKMALMPLLDQQSENQEADCDPTPTPESALRAVSVSSVSDAGSSKADSNSIDGGPPITAADLRAYVRAFLSDLSVEVLSHGNVLASKVEGVCR